MNAAALNRWFDNKAWLFAADWLVSRNYFVSGLLIAIGLASSVCEIVLRHLSFLAGTGTPIGVAAVVVGASGLFLAALTSVVLALCDLD